MGLWLRVWGFGFGVEGAGLKVYGWGEVLSFNGLESCSCPLMANGTDTVAMYRKFLQSFLIKRKLINSLNSKPRLLYSLEIKRKLLQSLSTHQKLLLSVSDPNKLFSQELARPLYLFIFLTHTHVLLSSRGGSEGGESDEAEELRKQGSS